MERGSRTLDRSVFGRDRPATQRVAMLSTAMLLFAGMEAHVRLLITLNKSYNKLTIGRMLARLGWQVRIWRC